MMFFTVLFFMDAATTERKKVVPANAARPSGAGSATPDAGGAAERVIVVVGCSVVAIACTYTSREPGGPRHRRSASPMPAAVDRGTTWCDLHRLLDYLLFLLGRVSRGEQRA